MADDDLLTAIQFGKALLLKTKDLSQALEKAEYQRDRLQEEVVELHSTLRSNNAIIETLEGEVSELKNELDLAMSAQLLQHQSSMPRSTTCTPSKSRNSGLFRMDSLLESPNGGAVCYGSPTTPQLAIQPPSISHSSIGVQCEIDTTLRVLHEELKNVASDVRILCDRTAMGESGVALFQPGQAGSVTPRVPPLMLGSSFISPRSMSEVPVQQTLDHFEESFAKILASARTPRLPLRKQGSTSWAGSFDAPPTGYVTSPPPRLSPRQPPLGIFGRILNKIGQVRNYVFLCYAIVMWLVLLSLKRVLNVCFLKKVIGILKFGIGRK